MNVRKGITRVKSVYIRRRLGFVELYVEAPGFTPVTVEMSSGQARELSEMIRKSARDVSDAEPTPAPAVKIEATA